MEVVRLQVMLTLTEAVRNWNSDAEVPAVVVMVNVLDCWEVNVTEIGLPVRLVADRASLVRNAGWLETRV
jgi:hypothetical protein